MLTLDRNKMDPAYSTAPRRVLLITYPRTASNLLVKMLALEDQPNVVSNEMGGYFFWDAFMKERKTVSEGKPIAQWNAKDTGEVRQAFQQNFNVFEDMSQSAISDGKIFFAKEHTLWFADPGALAQYLSTHDYQPSSSRLDIQLPDPYSMAPMKFSPKNFTIFPDEYLETWTPTFLVRHPALAFPSYYRALQKLEKGGFAEEEIEAPMLELHSTLLWTRLLYDWYHERKGNSYSHAHSHEGQYNDICFPLILDAHDIIHSPEILLRYCELLGMDPAAVKVAWQTQSTPGSGCAESADKVMTETLDHSSCLLKQKTPSTVDIAVERGNWEVEFGQGLAKQMEEWVRAAMPDYNYLWARRLKLHLN